MLATIGDDAWNGLNIQYKIPNLEWWDHSDIPGGSYE